MRTCHISGMTACALATSAQTICHCTTKPQHGSSDFIPLINPHTVPHCTIELIHPTWILTPPPQRWHSLLGQTVPWGTPHWYPPPLLLMWLHWPPLLLLPLHQLPPLSWRLVSFFFYHNIVCIVWIHIFVNYMNSYPNANIWIHIIVNSMNLYTHSIIWIHILR